MIRAHLGNDADWLKRHPANAAFLTTLHEAGVDTAAWLNDMPRDYPCVQASGGRVRIYAEQDALRVLQMGNHFNTCLGVGGVNAFSAVANACELNKRVIYATDGKGRVIGRKLIGINSSGLLVGFRTYTTLDGKGSAALKAIFLRYVSDFAARCGLQMAYSGTVPALFAERWYDDGIEPWTEQGLEKQEAADEQVAH